MIKKLRVTVDGKSYDVVVETPDEGDAASVPAQQSASSAPAVPALPPPAAATAAPATSAVPAAQASTGPGGVPSPLSGRVTAIVVTPGQEVKENDHLLTLEAMKMNTFVFAPKSGKVAEIRVAVGDVIEEGQELARIE